jgi:hypothetical protein
MALHGFSEHADTAKFEAYLKIEPNRADFARTLKQTKKWFRNHAIMVPKGLDSMPISWLKGLPYVLWSLRKPHWDVLPFMTSEVAAIEGMLQLRFAQEQMRDIWDDHVGAYDRVRIAVNASLYPTRWRPLKRTDALLLCAANIKNGN